MTRASERIRLVVVSAGMGEPSSTSLLGERLAEASRAALEASGLAVRIEQIGLRGLAHGIADHLTMGFLPSGKLAQALDAVRAADAVIAVTPTFKAGYTGLFKSFWDLTEDGDIAGTPVLLAATGGSARHSLMIDTALRPLFSYLRADLVPTGVFAATEDFGADAALQQRIDRAGAELAQRVAWRAGTALGARDDAEDVPIPASVPDEDAVPAEHEEAGHEGGAHRPDGAGSASSAADGPIPDARAARAVDSELNAGQGESFRPASGLSALKLTPFDQLLGDQAPSSSSGGARAGK
ncbi:NAD(P)H-dependent oxidoreductase [Rothia sp. BD8]|uniref:CE1759 family FMN reductase n=1 Tax=Rothia sp. BD8 TaxID=2953894 RepID=UPI00384420C8